MKHFKIRNRPLFRITFMLGILIFVVLIIYILGMVIKLNSSKQVNISKYPNAIQVELASNEDQIIVKKQIEGTFDLSNFIENEEFKMSKTSQLIFYILSVQDNKCDIHAIAYDIHRAGNFNLEISQDANEIYFLMPEFATVYAATQSISKNVSELVVVDGREAVEELKAGGGLKFRIFKSSINKESSNKYEFNLMSLNESMKIDLKSVIYGKYVVTISKR